MKVTSGLLLWAGERNAIYSLYTASLCTKHSLPTGLFNPTKTEAVVMTGRVKRLLITPTLSWALRTLMTQFVCQTSHSTVGHSEKPSSVPKRVKSNLRLQETWMRLFSVPQTQTRPCPPTSHISAHSKSPDCIRGRQRASTDIAMAMAYTASSQFSPELVRTDSYSKDSSSPEPAGSESQPRDGRDGRGPHRRGYQACQRCRERKVKCDLGSTSHSCSIDCRLRATA